jgi:CheY-like chemotaxis protein
MRYKSVENLRRCSLAPHVLRYPTGAILAQIVDINKGLKKADAMTLSLKNVARRFLYGSQENVSGNALTRKKERPVLSAESTATAETILFVDDEPSILNMRRLVFETLGYAVLTALSGQEALKALEQHSVDAVVLDYLMPGMNGEETARCIRKLRGDIPIILSSGCLTVPESTLKIMTAVVEKSTAPEVLIEALAQQLTSCSTPNSPAAVNAESPGLAGFGIIRITP